MKETLNKIYENIIIPRVRQSTQPYIQVTAEDVEGDIPLLFLLLNYLRRKHLNAALDKDIITIKLN